MEEMTNSLIWVYTFFMKGIVYSLFLFFAVLLFSCKNENPVEQYGNTLIKTYKEAQPFGDKTSAQNLQNAVKGFYAANGRYPNDLKELEGFTGGTIDESKYDYDPATGVITQKKP